MGALLASQRHACPQHMKHHEAEEVRTGSGGSSQREMSGETPIRDTKKKQQEGGKRMGVHSPARTLSVSEEFSRSNTASPCCPERGGGDCLEEASADSPGPPALGDAGGENLLALGLEGDPESTRRRLDVFLCQPRKGGEVLNELQKQEQSRMH